MLYSDCYDNTLFQSMELHRIEATLSPKYSYQGKVTLDHRRTVLEWLRDVSAEWETSFQALVLGCDLVDRALGTSQFTNIRLGKLQLLGLTCLWIATKFHAVYPVKIINLVHLCPENEDEVKSTTVLESNCLWMYSKEDFLLMEQLLANALHFDFRGVTILRYLEARHVEAIQAFAIQEKIWESILSTDMVINSNYDMAERISSDMRKNPKRQKRVLGSVHEGLPLSFPVE